LVGEGDGELDAVGEGDGEGELDAVGDGDGDAVAVGDGDGDAVAVGDGEGDEDSESLGEGEVVMVPVEVPNQLLKKTQKLRFPYDEQLSPVPLRLASAAALGT
jgi:hypothetical protein